jgi:hypothetical protein
MRARDIKAINAHLYFVNTIKRDSFFEMNDSQSGTDLIRMINTYGINGII